MQGSRSRRALLLLTVFVMGALVAIVGLATFGSHLVRSSSDPVEDFRDEQEDLLIEVEEVMLDFARQWKQQAFAGVLHHVADDFEGTPFLREPEGPFKVVGGVRMGSGGPDPRKGARDEFRRALEQDPPLTVVIFKFPSAQADRERLRGKMKIEAQYLAGSRAKRWVSLGDVEFVNRGGRWLLRRFSGEEIRTEEGEVRFHDATRQLGLEIPVEYDGRPIASFNAPYALIGGIAAGDFDGDGDDDIYVPRIGANLFFRNNGNGTFTECAPLLGVADEDAGAGALFLDYDNDGDLDVFLTNYEPSEVYDLNLRALVENKGRRSLVLYRNDGSRFRDVTREAGLLSQGAATSACAADIDGDGDLDLYVCRYRGIRTGDGHVITLISETVYNARDGEPNQLWINQGDGTFREEGAGRGVADTGWSLAAGFGDFDADGDPDLYVANDFGDNRLFKNGGKGRFEEVAGSGATDTGFGMGVAWLDFDRDGKLDLYVANMYSTAGNRILSRGPGRLSPDQHQKLLKLARGNTLLRNKGDGSFEDVTASLGAGRAGWAWGTASYDYDNDGLADIYVANGYVTGESALDL